MSAFDRALSERMKKELDIEWIDVASVETSDSSDSRELKERATFRASNTESHPFSAPNRKGHFFLMGWFSIGG